VLVKDIRNNKALWTPESNAHKLKQVFSSFAIMALAAIFYVDKFKLPEIIVLTLSNNLFAVFACFINIG